MFLKLEDAKWYVGITSKTPEERFQRTPEKEGCVLDYEV